MNYFGFVLILCSEILYQKVLSENLESQDQLIDVKTLYLDSKTYKQEDHLLRDVLPNNEECFCGSPGSFKGKCKQEEGNKICKCEDGYILNEGKCEVMKTSTPAITQTNVLMTKILQATVSTCDCGPYGTCSFEYGFKKCNCNQKYIEKNGICKYCDCGEHSHACGFNRSGDKVCQCHSGYDTRYGDCEACDCGNYSNSCHYNSLSDKTCDCFPGYEENYGYCEVCDCGPHGSCQFYHGSKKCDCNRNYSERNATCEYCSCGENSYSCTFDQRGDKVCGCEYGYDERHGYCEASCKNHECKYGICEIIGNTQSCRCNEGYTGMRCEKKVPFEIKKTDIWTILQISITFATFLLLSVMFCVWTRFLNILSKK